MAPLPTASASIDIRESKGAALAPLFPHRYRSAILKEIKQAVAGYGSAEKRQVQEMVRALLQLDSIPKPDDAADALAVAITHLSTKRYDLA